MDLPPREDRSSVSEYLVIHCCIAAFYLLDAFAGCMYRTEPGLRFLVGFGSLSVAWGLYRRSQWALVAQIAVWCALLFIAREAQHRNPMDPIATLWHFVFIVLTTGGPFLFGLLTAAMVLRQRAVDARRPMPTFLTHVVVIHCVMVVMMIAGDFIMPGIIADKETRQAERKKQQEQERELANQELRLQERRSIEQAYAALGNALKLGDANEVRAADDSITMLHQLTERELWSEAIVDAEETVQLHLVNEYVAGRTQVCVHNALLDRSTSAHILQIARIARRRETIQRMYKPGSGTVRKMGSLKELPHPEVVALLADALSDRENTTPQERIDLAVALLETAELPDFDARPAIQVLESIVAGDDDPAVLAAVNATLSAARKEPGATPQ